MAAGGGGGEGVSSVWCRDKGGELVFGGKLLGLCGTGGFFSPFFRMGVAVIVTWNGERGGKTGHGEQGQIDDLLSMYNYTTIGFQRTYPAG